MNLIKQIYVIVILLSLGAPASSKTYFVATNGNDENSGTSASPFKTIARAVDVMVAGDTTYVRGGVYNESRSAMFKKSGTETARIQLLAAPGEAPIIDYAFAKDYHRRIVISNEAGLLKPTGWIVIEGFEIRNAPAAIMFFNVHDTIIRRNWIHHAKAQGILGNGKNNVIDRNIVSQNGGRCVFGKSENDPTRSCNQFHGMYLTGSNWTITNNLIYDNLASGIHVAGYPWCTDGKCYGGGSINKTDPSYAGAANWVIANNTIAYQKEGAGIIVWQPGAIKNRIINNIFYENSQSAERGTLQGISFWGSGEGHIVQNNLSYASGAGGTAPYGGSTGWQNKFTDAGGNIVNVSSPRFVNALSIISGTPNFRLQSSSPAIDMGLEVDKVTRDFSNVPRPQRGKYDIGAFEFGSGPVPLTPKGFRIK